MNAPEGFRAAMRSAGIDYAGRIETDGTLHRVKAEGDRHPNSWYILHAGPPAAGAFGCWKRDLKETWCERRNGDSYAQAEWDSIRRRWREAQVQREQFEAELHGKARRVAQRVLARSKPVHQHPYLTAKAVKTFGTVREYHGALVLPLRDAEGILHSLQFIGADGSKRFLTGGRVTGCCFAVADEPAGPLVIAEGYATAASIFEATGFATVAAMHCGNLLAVTKALRAKWPDRAIIIAADNDQFTVGNPGICKARAAARVAAARLACPAFKDTTTRPTDFNDLHRLEGRLTVKNQILSAEPAQEEEPQETPRLSAATRVLQIADGLSLFHDQQDRAFVKVPVHDHLEVWPVASKIFRSWLARSFYVRTGSAANRNAIADAVMVLESRAQHDCPEEAVFLRVAPYEDGILIDLGDRDWRVLQVTSGGWHVRARSPVPFFRTQNMSALPEPVTHGSVAPMWEWLNVTPAQRPLIVGALLNALNPHGPFFVISLVGEQGSAKSTCARILRSLADPNEIALRSPPREERDLLVQAANNWFVVLDNLSGLPAWLSDALCRLSTGVGHSARQLFSDGEEFTLAVKRPVILTGIDDVATRPDLAERALQVELEPIPDHRRMSEAVLWKRFEAARATVFTALVAGVSHALRELPNLQVERLPRMADAVMWAAAAEPALGWARGTFYATYMQTLNDGAAASVESHPVGVAVRRLLDEAPEWCGEPAELLATLNDSAAVALRHAANWPRSARALSSCLRRLAQALRRAGIHVEFAKGKRRTIRMCKGRDFASPASPASPHAPPGDVRDAKDARLQPLHAADVEITTNEEPRGQAMLI